LLSGVRALSFASQIAFDELVREVGDLGPVGGAVPVARVAKGAEALNERSPLRGRTFA
jgi:hypothetical protein